MKVYTVTEARKNIYALLDSVNQDEPVIINNTGTGDMAVMLSMADWEVVQETMYLNSVPALAQSILEADKEDLKECEMYSENTPW